MRGKITYFCSLLFWENNMLKVTITGKPSLVKIRELLEGELAEFRERLELREIFIQGIVDIEVQVISKRGSLNIPVIILETTSLREIERDLQKAHRLYNDVSLTIHDVDGIDNTDDIDEVIGEDLISEAELLSLSIEELGFLPATTSALKRLEIDFVRDLISKTGKELLQQRNIGKKRLREIREKLSSRGLKLRGD